jgi:hypothetical protein
MGCARHWTRSAGTQPDRPLPERFAQAVEERSLIDAAFGAVIGTSKQIEELPRMARECGICSYKFYMAYTKDEAAVFGILAVDDAQFLDGLRTVREIGRPWPWCTPRTCRSSTTSRLATSRPGATT